MGLDIQPGFIAAAQGRASGSVMVDKAAAMSLAPDTLRHGEVNDEAGLAEALKELFGESGMSKRVRVGIANQRTVLRTLELPPVTDAKELAAAVNFQAQEQVPMPLNNAVLDFHPLGVIDTPAGPRQRVVLVAAQRDMIERLLGAIERAGLIPVGIDLSAFALIRSLYAPEPQSPRARAAEETPRVLYLNVDGLTNLAIAEGPVCRFTRVVAGGIESMAAELAAKREISTPEARALLFAANLAEAPNSDEWGPALPEQPAPPERPPSPSPSRQPAAGAGLEPEAARGARRRAGGRAGPRRLPGARGGATPSSRRAATRARSRLPTRTPTPTAASAREDDEDVYGVLESGIRDIYGEVRNSLDFHRSQEGGGEVSHVVLSGAAQDIPGFADALQAALGIEVKPREVQLAGSAARRGLRPPAGRRRRARRRGGHAVKAVNLIPVERRVGAGVGLGRSQGGAYAVIALVGVLALLVFVYGKASHEITSDNAQAAKLTTEAEQARSDAGALARYNGLIAQSEARTTAAEGLMDPRFDWAHALHELGRVLPTQVSIASLDGTDRSHRSEQKGAPRSSAPARAAPAGPAPAAASSSVTSATPAGTVPTRDPHRLRHQPDGGGGNAPADEADRRRQGSHATSSRELHRLRQRLHQLPEPQPHLHRERHLRTAAGEHPEQRDQRLQPGHARGRAGRQHRELQMTGRDRLVLIGVIAIAVVGVVWLMFVSPERKKAGQAAAAVAAAEAQLASAHSELVTARAAQAKYAASYGTIVHLGKAVPTTQEVPSLMYELAQASKQKSVEFASISSSDAGTAAGVLGAPRAASSAAPSAGGFQQMPFTFVFNGTYFGLEHMLRQLTNFATKTRSGAPEGQRPPADDPGRGAPAARRSRASPSPTPT